MRQRSNNFCAERHGTTLIEVIAGLVILGTLLSSLLIARNRFVRQEAQAKRQLAATHALDAMVAKWMDGPASAVPTQGNGPLPDSPDQIWHTHLIAQLSVVSLKAKIVRVEVMDRSERNPLVSLDLLLQSDPVVTGANR
jgi:Tfp pilus assembly protein PilV